MAPHEEGQTKGGASVKVAVKVLEQSWRSETRAVFELHGQDGMPHGPTICHHSPLGTRKHSSLHKSDRCVSAKITKAGRRHVAESFRFELRFMYIFPAGSHSSSPIHPLLNIYSCWQPAMTPLMQLRA